MKVLDVQEIEQVSGGYFECPAVPHWDNGSTALRYSILLALMDNPWSGYRAYVQ